MIGFYIHWSVLLNSFGVLIIIIIITCYEHTVNHWSTVNPHPPGRNLRVMHQKLALVWLILFLLALTWLLDMLHIFQNSICIALLLDKSAEDQWYMIYCGEPVTLWFMLSPFSPQPFVMTLLIRYDSFTYLSRCALLLTCPRDVALTSRVSWPSHAFCTFRSFFHISQYVALNHSFEFSPHLFIRLTIAYRYCILLDVFCLSFLINCWSVITDYHCFIDLHIDLYCRMWALI